MASPTTAQPGLRERKKGKTRRALLEVSDRLFRENGYRPTTLEQICDEADVSLRTFFRYFDGKGDLALAIGNRNMARVRACVDAADPAEVLSELRVLFADFGRECDTDPHAHRRVKFVMTEPTLIPESLALDLQMERHITSRLAAVPGADALGASLVAAMIIAGQRAALTEWINGPASGKLAPLFDQVLSAVQTVGPVVLGTKAERLRRATRS